MGQFTQVGPRCLKERHLRRARPLPILSAHAHHCCISFVALILHSLLRCRSDCLLVRILRQIAVAPNYFFPIYDSNQPLGLACVPGNFHLIRAHTRLLARLRAGFSNAPTCSAHPELPAFFAHPPYTTRPALSSTAMVPFGRRLSWVFNFEQTDPGTRS